MTHAYRSRTDELRGQRVLVLGDLILDRYTWGNAERVSPEAPVLVLRADQQEMRPGGAASVAVLLRHLDAEVTLAGVIGNDAAARSLVKMLHDERVGTQLVHSVDTRPTTTKERFLGRASNRHPHQILRVDHETREPIDTDTAARLHDGILQHLSAHSVVIISDYAKGVCTPELLAAVINATRDYSIPVVVDPARLSDYSRYGRASLITPNRDEAELATGIKINSPADALHAGRVLIEHASLDASFITIDRDGIAVTGPGTAGCIEATTVREVYDITGAGDMVVAVAALCQAAGLPLNDTARLANTAAGLEIQQLGIAPVTWGQIMEAEGAGKMWQLSPRNGVQTRSPVDAIPNGAGDGKIVSVDELSLHIGRYRAENKRIVFTNGCFDLLHVGHVTYLQQAAQLGDVLIVAINSDTSIQRLKGNGRPVIGAAHRALLLAALGCVDHVLVFDQETPHELLRNLRPDVLVKGGTTVEVVGREVVESYGGKVVQTDRVAGASTTTIVQAIRQVGAM